jgi:hypothetical protein
MDGWVGGEDAWRVVIVVVVVMGAVARVWLSCMHAVVVWLRSWLACLYPLHTRPSLVGLCLDVPNRRPTLENWPDTDTDMCISINRVSAQPHCHCHCHPLCHDAAHPTSTALYCPSLLFPSSAPFSTSKSTVHLPYRSPCFSNVGSLSRARAPTRAFAEATSPLAPCPTCAPVASCMLHAAYCILARYSTCK